MIRKYGLFAFLKQMGLFGSYAVDDAGAGAGDDIGDLDLDDLGDDAGAGGNPNPDGDGDDKTSTGESLEELKAMQKKIQELEADKEARENQEAQQRAISNLEQKYDGFDANAVKDYLVELNKTDPDKAQALNNSVGWENVWITELAPKVDNDAISFGRNVAPVDRSEEVLEKVNEGTVTFADEQDVLGKLLV